MSGQRRPFSERIKPPASKWLVAPRPSLNSSQRRPIINLLSGSILLLSVTGSLQPNWMYTSAWSCRFSPTPGRSWRTPIPALRRTSAGPMPERCNRCGEPIGPEEISTSRLQYT
ncbi:hypothetical protein D3C86_1563400 [compost metagenome]